MARRAIGKDLEKAMRILRYLFGLLLLLTLGNAWALVAVPTMQAHVTDLTETLTNYDLTLLEKRAITLERARDVRLAVLLLPSTLPESIDEYSMRVAAAWNLERDGVLLLIAKNDRRIRVLIGRGRPGALSAAASEKIILDTMTQHFKQRNFEQGIRAGIATIDGIIQSEHAPPPVVSDYQIEYGPLVIFLTAFLSPFLVLLAVVSFVSRQRRERKLKLRAQFRAANSSVSDGGGVDSGGRVTSVGGDRSGPAGASGHW